MMEFLSQNYLNTTTMISVTSGTTSAANLFDQYETKVYQSVGKDTDTTSVPVRIEFPSNILVDRVILQNINLKGFKIYYNSNTANTFTLLNAATTTSAWTNNSETSLYLQIASATSLSILTIDATSTMAANEEKQIGELRITERYFEFENDPSADDYDVKINRKEYVHEMSDGGISVYGIADRFEASIRRRYVTPDEYEDFKALYAIREGFTFVPFPTGAGWDGRIYEVIWTGPFEFERYADNYKDNGYMGTIRIRETSK